MPSFRRLTIKLNPERAKRVEEVYQRERIKPRTGRTLSVHEFIVHCLMAKIDEIGKESAR